MIRFVSARGTITRTADHSLWCSGETVGDSNPGAILAASNISGVSDIDFVGLLTRRLGLPLFVENAVDMATRGERWRGGARNVENFVFIGHGAGIGMGAVI